MNGIKYIFNYISKEKVLLTISALFILLATYLQVEIPKIMGNTVTHLTNYTIVENMQNTKNTILNTINAQMTLMQQPLLTMEDYEKIILNMSDEEVDKQLKDSGQNLTNEELKAKTGFTFKELMTMHSSEIEKKFNNTIILFLATIVGFVISMYIYTLAIAYIGSKSVHLMKINLFRKLHQLSISYFDKRSDGDVLSVFTNDMDNIMNFINQSLVQVISSIILLLYIGYTMFMESVPLASIIVGLGAILCVIIVIIMKKANKYVGVQQQKLGALNAYIDEQISGQKVNISNGVEDEVYTNFLPYNEDFTNNSIKGQIYSGLLIPINRGFMLLALAFVILVGSRLVVDNVIEIGLLVTFITFTQNFFNPFNQISSQYNTMQLSLSGAERVREVINEENELYVSKEQIRKNSIDKSIEFKNVNFSYTKDKQILKDLNFEVKKGQTFAVVGPTGSGKTTIMNLLNRFYDLDSGQILFDGIDIKEMNISDLRNNIGIVLQDSVLFSGTIKENIAYGIKDAPLEDVIKAAKLANIHDFIETLEDGYETQISNSNTVFSTGQKQLISIARTIYTNPSLLILDEATSNVDTVTEAKIQKAMDAIIQKRTSFVIAHRLKTILNADVILVLLNGEIIQMGNHDKLVKEEGLYKELYTNQFVFE